jgi:GntR family transcriptional repressor for pyruvate dehydrogenase complex
MVLKRTTLVGATVEELLSLIESRHLQAGDTLPSTSDLADELEVSRTVIREAIAELAGQGLLVRRQGKDTEIAFPGSKEFERLLRIRGALLDTQTEETVEFFREQAVSAARLAACVSGQLDDSSLSGALTGIIDAATPEARAHEEERFLHELSVLSKNALFTLTIDGCMAVLGKARLDGWERISESEKLIQSARQMFQKIRSSVVGGQSELAMQATHDLIALIYRDAASRR